jgi:hypothetical protein
MITVVVHHLEHPLKRLISILCTRIHIRIRAAPTKFVQPALCAIRDVLCTIRDGLQSSNAHRNARVQHPRPVSHEQSACGCVAQNTQPSLASLRTLLRCSTPSSATTYRRKVPRQILLHRHYPMGWRMLASPRRVPDHLCPGRVDRSSVLSVLNSAQITCTLDLCKRPQLSRRTSLSHAGSHASQRTTRPQLRSALLCCHTPAPRRPATSGGRGKQPPRNPRSCAHRARPSSLCCRPHSSASPGNTTRGCSASSASTPVRP